MALTLEHDRRQRSKKQAAEMRAKKEREIDRVIEIAVKRYNGNGIKRGGIIVDAESTEAQIAALDLYITDLRLIGEEMELLYGPGIERRLWRIDLEIDQAIEAIAKLKMDQVKPGE